MKRYLWAAVVTAVFFAADAIAAEGLSSLVKNVGDEAKSSVGGVNMILYFIGFVSLAAGIIMGFAANRHGGGGMGRAIAIGLLGIILLGYTTFVRKGTVSLYKKEGEGINKLSLDQAARVRPMLDLDGPGDLRISRGMSLR